MNKLIIVIVLILLLAGCGTKQDGNGYTFEDIPANEIQWDAGGKSYIPQFEPSEKPHNCEEQEDCGYPDLTNDE